MFLHTTITYDYTSFFFLLIDDNMFILQKSLHFYL